MWGNVLAEVIKLTRRPASWLLLGIAAVLGLTFNYVVPYAGYAGGTSGPPNSDRGLAAMLPGGIIGSSTGGLPVFLGAILLILGVLAVGGEYGWATWKTVLGQGPSRLTVYAAKLVAIAVATLSVVLTIFTTSAVASVLVAAAEGQEVVWPALSDLVVAAGAGWLIAMMWAMLGVMLAVALRGVALPIGLGLVWMLAVQNLLASIAAPLLDWVADLQTWMPGPNAGSLVASLGASAQTPGVVEMVGSGRAAAVIGCYLVAFALLGGLLLRRRDIL